MLQQPSRQPITGKRAELNCAKESCHGSERLLSHTGRTWLGNDRILTEAVGEHVLGLRV